MLAPRTIDEWRRAFRATATIPFVAGPPVALHGRMWIDGSVAEPLPVPRALREGATHVLALLNRSVPELRLAEPEAPPARWAAAIDRVVPGLGAMAQESRRHGEVVALLADAGHIQRAGAHVLAVAPRHGLGIRGPDHGRPARPGGDGGGLHRAAGGAGPRPRPRLSDITNGHFRQHPR